MSLPRWKDFPVFRELGVWLYPESREEIVQYLQSVAQGNVTHVSAEPFGYSEGSFCVQEQDRHKLLDLLFAAGCGKHYLREVPLAIFPFFVDATFAGFECFTGSEARRRFCMRRLVGASQRAVADFHGGWGSGAARCVALVSENSAQLHFPDCAVDAGRALRLRQAICDDCFDSHEYAFGDDVDMYAAIDDGVYGPGAGPRLIGGRSRRTCPHCLGRAKERLTCNKCDPAGKVPGDGGLAFYGEFESPRSHREHGDALGLDLEMDPDPTLDAEPPAVPEERRRCLMREISVRRPGLRLRDDWAVDPMAAPVRSWGPSCKQQHPHQHQQQQQQQHRGEGVARDYPDVAGDRAGVAALKRGGTEVDDMAVRDALQREVNAYCSSIYGLVHVFRIFRHERRRKAKAPTQRLGGDVERSYTVLVCGRGSACCMNLHTADGSMRSHSQNSIYFRVTEAGIAARCLCSSSKAATKFGPCSSYESTRSPISAASAAVLFAPSSSHSPMDED